MNFTQQIIKEVLDGAIKRLENHKESCEALKKLNAEECLGTFKGGLTHSIAVLTKIRDDMVRDAGLLLPQEGGR